MRPAEKVNMMKCDEKKEEENMEKMENEKGCGELQLVLSQQNGSSSEDLYPPINPTLQLTNCLFLSVCFLSLIFS